MRIKSFKQFEGISEKNMDVKTGQGILNKLNSTNKLVIETGSPAHALPVSGWNIRSQYHFVIDDFNISVISQEGPFRIGGVVPISSDGGTSYRIYVDGRRLRIGHFLSKKIFQRVKYIHDTPDREDKEYIKKDAYINFRNYK